MADQFSRVSWLSEFVASASESLACGLSPAVLCWQSLREEKQSYELELAQARAKYEEEAAQVKEGQAQALEELMEKHRAQLESARTTAEREKNQLLNASVHIHTQHSGVALHRGAHYSSLAPPTQAWTAF